MYYKKTLVQGCGEGKVKAYFWVQGWVGGSKMAVLGRTYFMDGPYTELLECKKQFWNVTFFQYFVKMSFEVEQLMYKTYRHFWVQNPKTKKQIAL